MAVRKLNKLNDQEVLSLTSAGRAELKLAQHVRLMLTTEGKTERLVLREALFVVSCHGMR